MRQYLPLLTFSWGCTRSSFRGGSRFYKPYRGVGSKDEEIKRWLSSVELNDFLRLFEDQARPKFENTKFNATLLEIFKNRHQILTEMYALKRDIPFDYVSVWDRQRFAAYLFGMAKALSQNERLDLTPSQLEADITEVFAEIFRFAPSQARDLIQKLATNAKCEIGPHVFTTYDDVVQSGMNGWSSFKGGGKEAVVYELARYTNNPIHEILPSKIADWDSENNKLAQKFIVKLQSFSHCPLNKQHGLRLLPFIESKPLVDLVAAIVKNYELTVTKNKILRYDIVGYIYCVDLLALYVVNEREDYQEILAVLEHEAGKEQELHRLLAEVAGQQKQSLISRVLRFYEKDTDLLDGLIAKLAA
jgi:hypothetical protein